MNIAYIIIAHPWNKSKSNTYIGPFHSLEEAYQIGERINHPDIEWIEIKTLHPHNEYIT